MNTRTILIWAGLFGFTGIILGALGAHALEKILSPHNLESFKTGVRYQVWHAIVLLAIGLSNVKFRFHKAIIICLISGIFLFSGSIYFLSTVAVSGLHLSFLGPVTPLGGLLLITAWFLLFWGAISVKKTLTEGRKEDTV